ncbi:MAG TPA: DinB family protein [Gemmatimonadaceae bacterium]|nr:DinB family protein [Gemmatimonadaceae bacterium]
MRTSLRFTLAALLVVAPASSMAAQQAAPTSAAPTGLVADLLRDVGQVERKMIGLAKAVPADKYGWRPGAGVRSIGDLVMHVTADNHFFPAILGTPADPATGITAEFKTAQAFEQRKLSRDSAIVELERSFAFLKKSLAATPEAKLPGKVSMFGQQFTVQQAWLLATVHLHEHLGQFIAYARSNGVTPPWSQ